MTAEKVEEIVRAVLKKGVALEIPDEEIARVVQKENVALIERVAALEALAATASKPARFNVLAGGAR